MSRPEKLDGYSLAARMRRIRQQHGLSATAQALFTELVALCNEADWADAFSIKTATLRDVLDISSENTLGKHMAALAAAGLIFYKLERGSRARCHVSFTTPFENHSKNEPLAQGAGANASDNGAGNDSGNASKNEGLGGNASRNASRNGADNASNFEPFLYNKEQTKTETSTTTPAAAPGDAGGTAPTVPPATTPPPADPPPPDSGIFTKAVEVLAKEALADPNFEPNVARRLGLKAREEFQQLREFLPGYMEEFLMHIKGNGTNYSTGHAFRPHFTNWVVIRVRKPDAFTPANANGQSAEQIANLQKIFG